MKNLILPMAGRSSRFPDTRPKWMLTHPYTSDLLCVESIKGLNLEFFDKIYFIFLREHDDKYKISHGLRLCLEKNELIDKCEFVILENPTSSQSETVYQAIKIANIQGFILIKDADGFFEVNFESTQNQVVYCDLNNVRQIEAKSKSYINMMQGEIITNIVEKKVISSTFCVGGYGFESTETFNSYYQRLTKFEGECYISHVIFEMILQGNIFVGKECSNFIDWGTQEQWIEYCSNFSTYFVDLDGVLVTNSSQFIPPYIGEGLPLEENIEVFRQKHAQKKCKIIITTSRPDHTREQTIKELDDIGMPFDILIMGLPHARRYLINDFSKTNVYPSAVAINIERNTQNLKSHI